MFTTTVTYIEGQGYVVLVNGRTAVSGRTLGQAHAWERRILRRLGKLG